MPVILFVAAAKLLAHHYGWEFLSMNGIFAAFISANIFLIGFNISGVLSDFKAGEKLPGELAAHIEAIADECVYLAKNKGGKAAREGFLYCLDFTNTVLEWFYKKVRTKMVLEKVAGFTDVFHEFQTMSKTSYISRLKHEQSEIRKAIMRIHTIREVRFSEAAYAVAEIITFAIVAAMIFLQIDPFIESMFCTIFVAFVFVYMLLLIRDLDDPFAYYDQEHSIEEISLHSLEDLRTRLAMRRKHLDE
ncbi:MAG: hypothetical protein MUD10_03010 [Candidatus Pacebacteria bacterium]|nr:hypothetical protein [Candidatus Paceibacterota bacterium]